jgi:cytoskeletal protein CcmA (bactofilin family)
MKFVLKKVSLGVISIFLASTPSVFAISDYYQGVPTGITSQDSIAPSDSAFDNLDMASNGDLINSVIQGDFRADKNITISNSVIQGNLTVNGNLNLNNSQVTWNLIVTSNIEANNANVDGYWLVSGNAIINNSDFNKAAYIYGKAEINNSESTEKIKVILRSTLNNVDGGRIYQLGKGTRANTVADVLKAHPIMTRVDPYLAIDTTPEEFATLNTQAMNMQKSIDAAKVTLSKELAVYRNKKTRPKTNQVALEAAKKAIIDAKASFFQKASVMLTGLAVDKTGFDQAKAAEMKATQTFLNKYNLK